LELQNVFSEKKKEICCIRDHLYHHELQTEDAQFDRKMTVFVESKFEDLSVGDDDSRMKCSFLFSSCA
jgi:hypothetical protein